MNSDFKPTRVLGVTLGALLCFALLIAILFGAVAGCKTFNRTQARADARNRVSITHIEIQRAQQQAQINNALKGATKAFAERRLIEARGIRAAQDEISTTLTDRYLQHEAIQAQLKMAGSPSHTQVYVPSGNNGIPVVQQAPKP